VVSCSHFAQPAPPTSAVTLGTLHAPADRQESGQLQPSQRIVSSAIEHVGSHANRRSPSSLLSHSPVRFQLATFRLTSLRSRSPAKAAAPERRQARPRTNRRAQCGRLFPHAEAPPMAAACTHRVLRRAARSGLREKCLSGLSILPGPPVRSGRPAQVGGTSRNFRWPDPSARRPRRPHRGCCRHSPPGDKGER
jgi:hypothetical protein